ncbi:MAG: rhodanese-like domain-containing protein [Thermoleophilia bacterium]|nr:rhodanese-like domain-containing protein [Thermoleophilia bacterium]
MKLFGISAMRTRTILVMAPLFLMVILMLASDSGLNGSAAASSYSLPLPPPPVPGFFPAPEPGPGSYAQLVTVYDVDALLADNGNKGRVHMIDVRSSFEYLADVCPMQIALGLPLYTETNVGHPVWNWPDGTYEEAYSNPYWIGFHWAGVPYASLWNIRMQENPNFHGYMQALVADGSIDYDDTLILLCQTGYRAAWAGKEAAMMGFTDVRVLHGGMLAWSDDWFDQDFVFRPSQDPENDPSPGDCSPDLQAQGYDNCDPDNVPGSDARPKTTVLTDPWKYSLDRLTAAGFTPYWNGAEPHVGVKPQWLPGDFNLSLSKTDVYWASYADYLDRMLSVELMLKNNAPDEPGPLNYPAACGGAPPPEGTCEQVNQAAHGTAYNAMFVAAAAGNGVTAATLPAMVGDLAPNASGSAVIKFNVPTGVSFFTLNPYAVATDVPDPGIYNDGFHDVVYDQDISWYGTYAYPGPPPTF